MTQSHQAASQTAASRHQGRPTEAPGRRFRRDGTMWKEVTISWTIAAALVAGLFVGSFVPTNAADQRTVEQAALTVHYMHRQIATPVQDQSGKFTVYVRAIAPRASQ